MVSRNGDFTQGETVPLKSANSHGSYTGVGGGSSNSRLTPPGSARTTTSRKSYASSSGGANRSSSRSDAAGSRQSHVLLKTQTSMVQDARTFAEGSIPHSMAIGTVIGIVCGVAAFLYYAALFWVLDFVCCCVAVA